MSNVPSSHTAVTVAGNRSCLSPRHGAITRSPRHHGKKQASIEQKPQKDGSRRLTLGEHSRVVAPLAETFGRKNGRGGLRKPVVLVENSVDMLYQFLVSWPNRCGACYFAANFGLERGVFRSVGV